MSQPPVPITGLWLDAYSGRIRVRVEIDKVWHNVINVLNSEGHISHIVEPAGILRSPPSPELEEPK